MPSISNPNRWTISYTITVRPAAGPLTCNGEPASDPTTIPPTIPVIRPAATGTPEAIAIPMQSGNATRKTTIDAKKSCLMFEPIPFSSKALPFPFVMLSFSCRVTYHRTTGDSPPMD